jgi:endo-1,4-beta-xylanase
VVGITLWGWRPGLYNEIGNLVHNDGSERPALEWLRDYLQSNLSVEDHPVKLPQAFMLDNNYPNPFNPSTKISYHLPHRTKVILEVFDIMGRHIQTLVNKDQSPGQYTVIFNASNSSSGIYFYRLSAGSLIDVKQMLLLK